VTTAVNRPRDGSNLGEVIRTYMRAHSVSTHAEMAAVLGIDRTLVSKYVSGARRCHDLTQLRRFAEAMDVSPSTFGLVDAPDGAEAEDGTASDDNERWKATRKFLNRNRHVLSKVAADLYWEPVRIEGTTCITVPGWMPEEPVDLSAIELSWVGDAAPATVSGTAPEGAAYRGQGQDGQPYHRYSQAIRALASPSLFENRGSYRLLGLRWDSAGAQMRFGYM
jgi:transcriptional regulator with XRE-family HTH domain